MRERERATDKGKIRTCKSNTGPNTRLSGSQSPAERTTRGEASHTRALHRHNTARLQLSSSTGSPHASPMRPSPAGAPAAVIEPSPPSMRMPAGRLLWAHTLAAGMLHPTPAGSPSSSHTLGLMWGHVGWWMLGHALPMLVNRATQGHACERRCAGKPSRARGRPQAAARSAASRHRAPFS